MQIISNKIFHSYSGKIKYLDSVDNKTIYTTDKQLGVLWLDDKKQQQILRIDGNEVIKVSAGTNGLIAILLSNSTLQIRKLKNLNELINKFTKINYNISDGYPKIIWQQQQIYLIYRKTLQVISLGRKQRKAYKDIIINDEKDKIQDIALSNVISKEKIAILQFHHKLTFNIIPIPITQVIINNINQIKNLYNPISDNQNKIERQYLMVIMDNNRLHIYNIINMKLLVQIIYQNYNHDRIKICSDVKNQYIVVQFSNEKCGKVTKNLLYKVNTKYYYANTSNYFNQQQCFFDYQLQIDIKQKINILTIKNIQNYTNIYLNYVNKSKKQIKLIYLKIPNEYKNKIKSNIKMDPTWKQVRQWKQIITSYVQMKNSIQKLDFDLAQLQKNNINTQLTSITSQSLSSTIKSQQQFSSKYQMYDQTQDLKQIQKYQKLNKQLSQATHKFQNNYKLQQIMTNSNSFNDSHQKKIQQQFYTFMRAYLKQQQLDVDPQKLFQLQFQTSDRKKNSKYIQVQDQDQMSIVLPLPSKKKHIQQKQQKIIQIQPNKSKSTSTQKINNKQQQQFQILECEFDQQKQEFDTKLLSIQNSIMKAFAPLQQKVQKLSQKIDKYQGLHIKQLKKCVNMVEQEREKTQNIDSMVHGYCKEVMEQFNNSLDNCLQSFWYKVEQTDRKGRKQRQNTLNEFGKHIDQQIKNRQYIFDSSRLTIENHLSHLRKKIVQTFIDDQEDEQFWQQEEKNVKQHYFGFYKPKI